MLHRKCWYDHALRWYVLLQGITLTSSQAVSNAKNLQWPLTEVAEGVFETEAPGGYKFYLQNHSSSRSGTVKALCLPVSLTTCEEN